MSQVKILAFAGSLRKESLNKKLVHCATLRARDMGAEVTEIDLADFPLPVYDGDLEDREGIPENARILKAMFADHDALMISAPEYNGGITAALKNTIDWISRPDDSGLKPYDHKWVGLMAASPGALGGIRALPNVRFILEGLGCMCVPNQLALGQADKAFDQTGMLASADLQKRLDALVARLIDVAGG